MLVRAARRSIEYITRLASFCVNIVQCVCSVVEVPAAGPIYVAIAPCCGDSDVDVPRDEVSLLQGEEQEQRHLTGSEHINTASSTMYLLCCIANSHSTTFRTNHIMFFTTNHIT